ncbi:MAG: ribonuclease H-like domain-containing protein [Bacteroidota bacterium]
MIATTLEQASKKILFLDIETVRGSKNYNDLSEGMHKMWELKAKRIQPDSNLTAEEKYYDNAGIFAEFGKITCISFGYLHYKEGILKMKVKSCYGKDEQKLLAEFREILDANAFLFLCAHNGREFDFPYMGRRYIINQMKLPKALELRDKRAWEIKHILDTMDMWKFGDWKNPTKLELLCNVLNVPTPKDDIDGSQVGNVYWEEGDVDRIAVYCEKDVVATAQVYLKYALLPLVEEENIEFAERVPAT